MFSLLLLHHKPELELVNQISVLGSAQQEQASLGELVPLSSSKAELMSVLGEKRGNMGELRRKLQ